MGQAISAPKKSSDKLYYVWVVIGLFFIFIFGRVVPPFAGIDSVGVSIIGIFIGTLLMVSFGNMSFWPLLVAFIAMIDCGFSTSGDLLTSWFGNTTIQMLIWLLAVTGAVADSGAVQVMVYKLLSLKIIKGRPKTFLFILFIGFMFCALLLQASTALVILYLTIVDGICKACDIEDDNELRRTMQLGVYNSVMGIYILPFKIVGALALAEAALEPAGLAFDTGAYIITAGIIIVAIMLIYWAIVCFVWKPDMTKLKNFNFEDMNLKPEQKKLNRRQIIMLVLLLVGVVYLFASTFAPAGGTIRAFTGKYGSVWIWVGLLAVMCIIRIDGKPMINGAKVMSDKVLWGIIAMAGCFSILGNCIASDTHGIKTAIANLINNTIGTPSVFVLVLFSVVLTTVVTNLTSGFAASYPLLAICLPIAATMQANGVISSATPLATVIIASSFFAYMTPGAIIYAPILLEKPGMTKKFIWTKGLLVVGIFIVLATAVGTICSYIL